MSDIHGNLRALEAVLEDIALQGVDLTVNLGDIVAGPLEPRLTLDRVMALDHPTIGGNHERVLFEKFMGTLERGDAPSQKLLFPVTLHLSSAEADAFEADRDVFARGMPETVIIEKRNEYSATLYDLLTAYAAQRQRRAIANVRIAKRSVWSLKEARDILARLVGELRDWTALDVFLIEASANRAVEVEHAHQPPVRHDRYDQLGAAGRVAGDMAGKGLHVLDALRFPAGRGDAADAPAEGNADAGRPALERAEHELAADIAVEAGPVELG